MVLCIFSLRYERSERCFYANRLRLSLVSEPVTACDSDNDGDDNGDGGRNAAP